MAVVFQSAELFEQRLHEFKREIARGLTVEVRRRTAEELIHELPNVSGLTAERQADYYKYLCCIRDRANAALEPSRQAS